MKKTVAILGALAITGASGFAQTNLRTVMVNSNGVVQRPNNFVAANNLALVGSAGVDFGLMSSQWRMSTFANCAIQESGGGNTKITNSAVYVGADAANTNVVAAIRLLQGVNDNGPIGGGTRFGSANHTIWMRLQTAVGRNGQARVTLGHSSLLQTNIGATLTNRGFGYEIDSTNGEALRVRLIAHNGSNATNGPWVNISDIFQLYTIGAKQQPSGTVQLYVGTNSSQPALISDATISGGPTSTAAGGNESLDIRFWSTETNSYNASAAVFSAGVESEN